jgi:hypothetical protein
VGEGGGGGEGGEGGGCSIVKRLCVSVAAGNWLLVVSEGLLV